MLLVRIVLVLSYLVRHVHVTGVSIRVGIVVWLLVCGVWHHRRLLRRLRLFVRLRSFRCSLLLGGLALFCFVLGRTHAQSGGARNVFDLAVRRPNLDTAALAGRRKDGGTSRRVDEATDRRCVRLGHVLLRWMAHVTWYERHASGRVTHV